MRQYALKENIKKLDDYGRYGDDTVAHLTTGEIVIPKTAQTPRLLAALMGEMQATGHDFGRYVVGGADDSRNPKTGAREFWDTDPMGSSADYGYGDGTTDASRAASENATNEMVGSINGAATAPTYNEDAAKAQYKERSLPQRAVDWVRDIPNMAVDKVRDMVNNPVATLIDFAIPGAPGLINGLVGVATDKTIGKALVGGFANATGYNDQSPAGQTPSGLSAGSVAKSNDDGPDPTPDDGRGGDGNGSTNPFGSKNSPLAQALLGNAQPGSPNFGGRKTYGAPLSSFSPNGREYVTPWAYRG